MVLGRFDTPIEEEALLLNNHFNFHPLVLSLCLSGQFSLRWVVITKNQNNQWNHLEAFLMFSNIP